MPSAAMIVELGLYGGLIPATAAAAICWLIYRAGRPTPQGAAHGGAAVAAVAGFALGAYLLEVTPWQPTASWHWLPYVAMLAAGVEAFSAAVTLSPVGRWCARLVLISVATRWLVPTLEDVQAHREYWRLALAVTMLVTWLLLDFAARGPDGAWLSLILGLVMVGAVGVLELAGFGRLALEAAALAAAIFGVAAVSWRWPESSAPGLVAVAAPVLPGMVFSGYWFTSDAPVVSLILVLAAPALVGLVELGSRGWGYRRLRIALLVAAALAPIACALVLASGESGEW